MDKKNQIINILENELSTNNYLKGHLKRIIESFTFLEKYLTDNQNVIDIGSYGHFTEVLSKFYNSNFDISDFELRETFPIDEKKYDITICMEVIEHMKDRDYNDLDSIATFKYSGVFNLLCETNRILKDGGILFLTTPNLNNYLSVLRLLNHENPYFFTPHPRELSVMELKRFLIKCGFEIIEFETKDVWFDYKEHANVIGNLKNFITQNNFSNDLRGDDIFIIAKKIKEPDYILAENEYFNLTLDEIYKKNE
jgi:SAM-dependent methyltransferase